MMDLHDSAQDWRGHAEREASAILNETGVLGPNVLDRTGLVKLMAAAWLQGVNYGAHTTLNMAEQAFEGMKGQL